jgi:hypothetical protein
MRSQMKSYVIRVIPPSKGPAISVQVTAPSDSEARRAAREIIGGQVIGIEKVG